MSRKIPERRKPDKNEILSFSKQEGIDSDTCKDARKLIIERLVLSDSNRARITRYYELATQPTISEADVAQIESIWRFAINDEQLAEALGVIDDMHPPCLAGEKLLADDQSFRAHLSDCLLIWAEEKLKRHKGELEELECDEGCGLDTRTVTLLCPNGSGAFTVRVPITHQSDLFGLNLDEKCPHCQHKLSEHVQIESSSALSHVCG